MTNPKQPAPKPSETSASPKLPPRETDDDNVVRQEQSKGVVRPDGPGDDSAPIERGRD